MIALITPVTYAWPRRIEGGGGSLRACGGASQETEGSAPVRAACMKSLNGATFPRCRSCSTVSNHGSGFQMPGVLAFCGNALQNIALDPQSGCVPLKT